jgi:NAD(P)H dehydrogenase (quinone)
MSDAPTIVVTGATGTIGRRVIAGLHQGVARVVAVTRDASRAGALPPGVAVATAAFEDPASLERAFAHADTLVLITASNARAEVQAGAALAAARAAGVRKIVRVSALKAAPDGPTDNTRQHGRTEAAIVASGLTHVILRPHVFMQNVLGSLPTILGQGAIYWGSGEGKMGMVDTRDVADAVVVAAASERFDGQTLELTGPASIDYHEVAAAVGRALGREVRFVPVPPEAAGDAMRRFGADDWTVGIVRDYSRAYAAGWGDFTSGAVLRVTGHAPRSIDDFAREVLAPAAGD